MSEKTAFISYRRDALGKAFVRSLEQALTSQGYDVFLDVDSINSGKWADQILTQVSRRAHFLLVLTPGALDLCINEDDWVRREFEAAKKLGRNIVPVCEESVDLKKFRDDCPDSMKEVFDYQIARIRHSTFYHDVQTLIGSYIPRHKAPSDAPAVNAGILTFEVAPTRLRYAADKLFGRDEELARLDAVWEDPRIHVLTIVAWGGVGKTSLVGEWMARKAAHGWRGFERVFDWPFHSQGTREQSAAADVFIAEALKFFGDPQMAGGNASPREKGERLARLVGQTRSLLVLDGIEPMQHPPGPMGGQLKDPALATLLLGLAQKNLGLSIVTTREHVADLARFNHSTAREWKLQHLPTPAGVELLKSLGVRGTDAEVQRLVEDVQGHALTINLLGRYLARAHSGDIRKRDQVKLEKADARVPGGHAFKTIEAYESWLAAAGVEGERQLEVMRLLGLFDRPADAKALVMLRKPLVISGLNKSLVNLAEEEWNEVLSNLLDLDLITQEGDAINCHPLIRQYFRVQLRERRPTAWRKGHRRLVEFFSNGENSKGSTELSLLQAQQLAIEHSIEGGEVERAVRLLFSPVIAAQPFSDWLIERGHLATADSILGRLATVSKGKILEEVLITRSAVALQLGQHQEALANIERAVATLTRGTWRKFVGLIGFLLSQAIWAALRFDMRLGEWHLRQKLTLMRALASRGNIHREAGLSSDAVLDYDRAARLIEPLFSKWPQTQTDFAKLLENRATAQWDLGHWSQALKDLESADTIYEEFRRLPVDPFQVSVWTNRGIVLSSLGQHKRALDDLEKALAFYVQAQNSGREELAPRAAHVRIILGSLLNEKHEGKRALSLLEDACDVLGRLVQSGRKEFESILAQAFMNRGRIHLSLGDWQRALEDYDKAAQIYERAIGNGRPQFEGILAHVLVDRSEANYRMGNRSRAEADRKDGLQRMRSQMKVWRNESDLVNVCLEKLLSSVQYLLPDSADSADEGCVLLSELLDELERLLHAPGRTEGQGYAWRHIVCALTEVTPWLGEDAACVQQRIGRLQSMLSRNPVPKPCLAKGELWQD